MAREDIFEQLDSLDKLEKELASTLMQVSKVKADFEQTLSENAKLRMELDKLRDRLGELDGDKKSGKSEPNANLVAIYDDGFHVCTDFYGQMRDAECLMCTELLYR